MNKKSALHEVLYVSTINPASPITIVKDITIKARMFNEARGITGLLIFNGIQFCQQLEGEPEVVWNLIEKIRRDPRHSDFRLVHSAPLSARRFKNFSLAYTSFDDADALESLRALNALSAMNAFVALLPKLDTDS